MTKGERKRRRARVLRFLSVLLFIAIIIVLFILFVLVFCKIKTVSVKGTDIYSDEQIEEMVLTEKYDRFSLSAYLFSLLKPKHGIPFIEKISIRPTSLSSVEISLKERDRTGVMQGTDSKYMYFDSKGKVTEVSKEYIDGSINVSSSELTGKGKAGEDLPLPATDLRTLVSLISDLQNLDYEIKNVNLNGDSGIVLYYENIEIRLGTKANLNQKVERLSYILPNLAGMSGILHLEDWSEENTDIVFDRTG